MPDLSGAAVHSVQPSGHHANGHPGCHHVVAGLDYRGVAESARLGLGGHLVGVSASTHGAKAIRTACELNHEPVIGGRQVDRE